MAETGLEDLHETQERLQAVIESSPLAIMEVDLVTRVIRWNAAAERTFGWSREEMLGQPGLPMVPPAKQAEHLELVARVRAGEAYTGFETVRQRKDGTLFDVAMAAAPVRDGSGRVVSHVVVYSDITEEKRQRAAVAAGEERLRAVIDASPVAIAEVDLETRVTRWNPAAEQIFGWPSDEMIGESGARLVPPSRQADFEQLVAMVRSGQPYTGFETVRQRKNGSLVDVEISAAPVRDGSGRVVSHMVVFGDITERKRQEAELHRLNAELEARLEDLAASRARIVSAADAERRRLERNLHDGAQQRLVTLSLSLRLALTTLAKDPGAARELLDGATQSSPTRSRSCGSSRGASTRRCSRTAASARRSNRSRAACRCPSRSQKSPRSGSPSRSRRRRTT
jgi:PAS domain S-box-containing protein